MRVFVTGGGGFVGSNLVHVFAERHGAEVTAPTHDELELTDPARVLRAIAAVKPDAIVHSAIWNQPTRLLTDRRRAWAEYVEATRNVTDAANALDAHVVLISTDWVFDGTQGPAAETEPPQPINAYGFLKACSELVVQERAARGAVARISAVQGVHRARPSLPRSQDAGFGYLAVSLVDALRAGEPFIVWDGPGLNRIATPTLVSDAAELIWRALERRATGILHCCGGEHTDRVGFAQRVADAFQLDRELLSVGPPPQSALQGGSVPVDTRLDAAATAAALDAELPELDTMLVRLKEDLENCWSTT
jgi:dTDP-4-dehydrorhamnose reductase